MQPPSGGCVLKLSHRVKIRLVQFAATFGWLCVETYQIALFRLKHLAATFGWLCVETAKIAPCNHFQNAATFGWLCVETLLAVYRYH